MNTPLEPDKLPPRIPVSVVCRLAGYSRSTLNKRIRNGKMPAPIDEARERIFLRDEVLKALGLTDGATNTGNPFEAALEKMNKP